MSVIYQLSDVDPTAIAICKKGANNQRIFLKKNAEDARQLPGAARILKQGDGSGGWEAFYTVVAEPGATEQLGSGDPGFAGDGADVWASEDEIRKACHRLLKNNAYVNDTHQALAAEGCHIVENAVALADFTVADDQDNEATIKKGSWYVAIEPSPEFKAKVDSGEITGVSVEGTGLRTLVQKAAGKPGSGRGGNVENLVRHYAKQPHPFRACMRDNVKRFGTERAERICGKLKAMGGRSGNIAKAGEDAWVDHHARELREAGLTDEDVEYMEGYFAIEKAAHQQAEKGLVRKMAERLGFPPEEIPHHPGTFPTDADREDQDTMTDEQFTELKKSNDAVMTAVNGLLEQNKTLLDKLTREPAKQASEAPADPAAIKKALDDFAGSVDEKLAELAKSVDTMAGGSSTQGGGDGGSIEDRVAAAVDVALKKNKEPLAGILD